MEYGTIKFFYAKKHFAFIAPDAGGKDLFCHSSDQTPAGLRCLVAGARVAFELRPDPKGPRVVNLRPA